MGSEFSGGTPGGGKLSPTGGGSNGTRVTQVSPADELEADGYTVMDLEAGILSGNIREVQRDFRTHERKYRIRGLTMSYDAIEQVVKFGPTGELVVITVYRP